MKHYDDGMTDDMRTIRNDTIQSRWSQLHALSKESGENAIKYLFAVNSGGSVATLTYLGSKINSTIGIKISLMIFFFGLITVGILKAYTLHKHEGLFANYQKQVAKYYENQIGWSDLLKSDNDKVGSPIVPYIFGYISFACFIVGSIIGAYTLM